MPATHRALVYQAHLRQDAGRAISALGGAKRVLACGAVMTEGFQVPMVAWLLDVRMLRVEASPNPPPHQRVAPGKGPNVIFQARDTRHAALLPTPQQILAWQQGGAHYAFHHFRTFYAFTTCPARGLS